MESNNEYEELRQLLHAMEEQSLDAAQQVRLDALLLDNAELRRYYLRYSNICGALRFARVENHGVPTVMHVPAGGASEPTASTSESLTVESRLLRRASIRGRRRALARIVGVSIAAGVAAIVAWHSLRTSIVTPDHSFGPTVVHATAGTPPAIKSIRLQSGTASLAIDKVGTVVIEGPADFDLLTPMRARLGGRGRLRMRVTETTGRGFVIETPSGEVTDLGTEFGLDLSEEEETGLVVFQGMVDLRVSDASRRGFTRPERLVEGEGVVFSQGGRLDRLSSILTGNLATFQRGGSFANNISQTAIISNVSDNARSSQSKKFYEIVPGGLKEDAPCYVDRRHQWNGLTEKGMPAYLLGADYVKTFGIDQLDADRQISITLTREARLFVFFDDRLLPPEWLRKDFKNTGDKIGLDAGKHGKSGRKWKTGVGPGNSVEDSFTVWERISREPGVVILGNNTRDWKEKHKPAMYGIAASAIPASRAGITNDDYSLSNGTPGPVEESQ